jgi:pimeloyl-ACP methyl ester carboxylesterase
MTDPHPRFPPHERDRKRAIVLVHGAWVGEWSWAPVLPLLRESGRAVHAVSLRGHGARRHESSPTVTLADHVDDVVSLVETFDLSDVTLVAHSYGGRVVTRSIPRLAERVTRLVYLDARAPLGDPLDEGPGLVADENGMVPFNTAYEPNPDEFGGAEAVDWFRQRTMPQSAAALNAPFHVDMPGHLDLTYVHATGDANSRFARYAAAARADPKWRYIELPGSHWLMVSHPREVAAIILDPANHSEERANDR